MSSDREFIEFLARSIVDHPDEVKVERIVDERGTLLKLFVSPADVGQMVGRGGMTARAMRTMLRIWGMRNQERVNLKIMDTDRGEEVVESEHHAGEAPLQEGENA
jgi:hypothetical protein